MIADAEKIVSRYLREHQAVSATGARIVGKTPAQTAAPWVRVTQLDAPSQPGSQAEHLITFLIQADCYAGAEGGQPEASLLARTVREALRTMPAAAHDAAVVTAVRFAGMPRIPDTDFEPARERFILTATVAIHTTG